MTELVNTLCCTNDNDRSIYALTSEETAVHRPPFRIGIKA